MLLHEAIDVHQRQKATPTLHKLALNPHRFTSSPQKFTWVSHILTPVPHTFSPVTINTVNVYINSLNIHISSLNDHISSLNDHINSLSLGINLLKSHTLVHMDSLQIKWFTLMFQSCDPLVETATFAFSSTLSLRIHLSFVFCFSCRFHLSFVFYFSCRLRLLFVSPSLSFLRLVFLVVFTFPSSFIFLAVFTFVSCLFVPSLPHFAVRPWTQVLFKRLTRVSLNWLLLELSRLTSTIGSRTPFTDQVGRDLWPINKIIFNLDR